MHAIGIDFGGTNIKVGIVSPEGKILAEKTRASEMKRGPEDVVSRMAELVNEVRAGNATPLFGIGLGCPGPLSRSQGLVYESPNLTGWKSTPVSAWLERDTGLPVRLDNDANCAALGEATYGVARSSRHVVVLTFGTGIGGGVLIHGKLLHGRNDGAAELGHIQMEKDGPPCPCGKRGCFEALCSATAVARRAKMSPEKLSELAEAGNDNARTLIEEIADDIARGVGSLVNIFNPEMVVLAGGLMRSAQLYLPAVQRLTPRYCFPSSSRDLKIEASTLHDRAGILGAAALWFNEPG